MKVVIGYDGSNCSERALDDLVQAGLPDDCDAAVISVAEVWLPSSNTVDTGIHLSRHDREALDRHFLEGKQIVAESQTLANHAARRIRSMFPNWSVKAEANYGSPSFEILSLADKMRADLIVVGSHGRSSLGRFYFGSVSQKILTEAKCTVRVARGRIEVEPGPARILIGFDGTPGAMAAVEMVRRRRWPENTEVRLIAAAEPVVPTSLGRFIPPVKNVAADINESEREWLETKAVDPLRKLSERGLRAELRIKASNPRYLLVEEAEDWGATSIFLGANSDGSLLQRAVIGSTSWAVAARANCSVEVVCLENAFSVSRPAA